MTVITYRGSRSGRKQPICFGSWRLLRRNASAFFIRTSGKLIKADLEPLVLRFIALEGTPHVRSVLRTSIAEADADPRVARRHFSFNVYDVDIDFLSGTDQER